MCVRGWFTHIYAQWICIECGPSKTVALASYPGSVLRHFGVNISFPENFSRDRDQIPSERTGHINLHEDLIFGRSTVFTFLVERSTPSASRRFPLKTNAPVLGDPIQISICIATAGEWNRRMNRVWNEKLAYRTHL